MTKRTGTKKATGKAPARVASTATVRAGALGADGDGADAGQKLVTEGFVRIKIGTEEFELRGIVGAHLKVAWHKPFEDGVDIGSVETMVASVAGALGVADAAAFQKQLEDKIALLGGVPALETVAKALLESPVRITDLGIDTQAKKYQFGFGLDLSTAGVEYMSIKLDAFGLLFTYTPDAT